MTMSEEYKQDLINIAKKLERKPQSFPKDEEGNPTETYLEYLSILYDPDITKYILELDVFPKTISLLKLARKVEMDKNELAKKLEPYTKKGFIVRIGKQYAMPMPLFVYDIPFILKENYEGPDALKLAQLSRKFYTDDKYYKTWETSRKGIPRMRVLTVSEEVENPKEILPIEEVYKIIDKKTDFAIIPCPCRIRADLEGIRECKDKYPIHNCIMLDPYAKAILEMGDPDVKKATKEDVIKLVEEASELGLVHCTDNNANNCNILCACCDCCCGMLKGLTRFDNPRAIAKANYVSSIDPELCTGCETCLGRCKFNAITVETIAKVNVDKCIGCGVCAVTCPSDAIVMKKFEREEIPVY